MKFKILDKNENFSSNNVLDIKQYENKLSEKVYKMKNALKKHETEARFSRRRTEYLICGKSFSKPSSFRTHVLVHITDLPWTHDFCPAKFKRKSMLKTHKLTHHNSKLVNILTTSLRFAEEGVCLIKLFCCKRSHCLCLCYLSSFPLLRP
ncbi:ZN836 protein, partial [Acromyrmex insinuator]